MNRRKKYRLCILFCLAADLAVMAFLGYQYLDRKIPDELQITMDVKTDLSELVSTPFVSLEHAIPASGEGSYTLECKLFGMLPFKEIKVTPVDREEIYVSGSTVGIYLETDGVLIIDTEEILTEDGISKDPAGSIVQPGDYIISFNEEKIQTKKDLIRDLEKLDGEAVTLNLKREGETIPVSITPVKDSLGKYKLGIWVRDDTQGIGTLTYVDKKGCYGALGHGISDMDTAGLLDISKGSLYKAQILSVIKGEKGSPGELSGLIRYENDNILGTIEKNTGNGIYGEYEAGLESGVFLKKVPVAHKQEARIGDASILCSLDGEVREYDAEITRIDLNHEDTNKSFVLRVTDEELLEKTGGIVQGMSGSPVLQDGKAVGAVTHVFVQDAASGYGIFIENMMGEQ